MPSHPALPHQSTITQALERQDYTTAYKCMNTTIQKLAEQLMQHHDINTLMQYASAISRITKHPNFNLATPPKDIGTYLGFKAATYAAHHMLVGIHAGLRATHFQR